MAGGGGTPITAGGAIVAVTVQFEDGIVPAKVVVPDPPHPETLVRVDPPVAVTVQLYPAPATWLPAHPVIVPLPPPVIVVESVKVPGPVKVAIIVMLLASDPLQLPTPTQVPPDQPAKVQPPAGVAMQLYGVPAVKLFVPVAQFVPPRVPEPTTEPVIEKVVPPLTSGCG